LRASAPGVATVLLLLPAIWNRYPLLQYDTGGYLARWFRPSFSRSTAMACFSRRLLAPISGWS
jgi:hypothetical protein